MPTDLTLKPEHTPLPLKEAAAIAYPHGGVGARALRNEARKGNLRIERVAGKYFTTLADIERMRERCRVEAKDRASSSAPPDTETACSLIAQPGESVTAAATLAQAALNRTLKALSES